MQHTDKAIAEFEAWYRDKYPMAERMIQVGSGVWMTHRDEMKECWLAARRELVIDLASAYRTDEDGYWVIGRTEARRSIEAAGVTVRG